MVAVAPGKGALGTFAPRLDSAGNSVNGPARGTVPRPSAGSGHVRVTAGCLTHRGRQLECEPSQAARKRPGGARATPPSPDPDETIDYAAAEDMSTDGRGSTTMTGDTLASWKDGPAKQAILDFVTRRRRRAPTSSRWRTGSPRSTTTGRCGWSSRCRRSSTSCSASGPRRSKPTRRWPASSRTRR